MAVAGMGRPRPRGGDALLRGWMLLSVVVVGLLLLQGMLMEAEATEQAEVEGQDLSPEDVAVARKEVGKRLGEIGNELEKKYFSSGKVSNDADQWTWLIGKQLKDVGTDCNRKAKLRKAETGPAFIQDLASQLQSLVPAILSGGVLSKAVEGIWKFGGLLKGPWASESPKEESKKEESKEEAEQVITEDPVEESVGTGDEEEDLLKKLFVGPEQEEAIKEESTKEIEDEDLLKKLFVGPEQEEAIKEESTKEIEEEDPDDLSSDKDGELKVDAESQDAKEAHEDLIRKHAEAIARVAEAIMEAAQKREAEAKAAQEQ